MMTKKNEIPAAEYITLSKIKYKDGRVILKYTNSKTGGQNRHVLDSFEEPRPEFIMALADMRESLISICELEKLTKEQKDRIRIIGVAISFTDQVRGLTITGLMDLKRSSAPLVINTPHKPEEPYTAGGDDSNCFDGDTRQRLDALEEAAKAYLAGHRAQRTLDLKSKAKEIGKQVVNDMAKQGVTVEMVTP